MEMILEKSMEKMQVCLILNHKAGIIDDVIAYHVENEFFLVSNCATYDNDKKWLESSKEL